MSDEAQYAVYLLDEGPLAMATGKGKLLYKGDDSIEVGKAICDATLLPENGGRTLRVYDYRLFGGGVNHIQIRKETT